MEAKPQLTRQLAFVPKRLGEQSATATATSPASANPAALAARQDLLEELKDLRRYIVQEHMQSEGPGHADGSKFIETDKMLLKLFVGAENARNPELKLRDFKDVKELGEALARGQLQDGRVTFLVGTNLVHTVAADIKHIEDRISILIPEPVKDVGHTLLLDIAAFPQMEAVWPDNTLTTVLIHETQKSANGCQIFALSGASKMADHPELFAALHAENVAREGRPKQNIVSSSSTGKPSANPSPRPSMNAVLPSAGGTYKEVPILMAHGRQRIVNATSILPAAFRKHGQSKTVLKAMVDARPGANHEVVNKKGQTLLQRFDANTQPRGDKSVNVSIEKKRLVYIDRALAYAAQAPAEEVLDMLKTLKADNAQIQAKWGPAK